MNSGPDRLFNTNLHYRRRSRYLISGPVEFYEPDRDPGEGERPPFPLGDTSPSQPPAPAGEGKRVEEGDPPPELSGWQAGYNSQGNNRDNSDHRN